MFTEDSMNDVHREISLEMVIDFHCCNVTMVRRRPMDLHACGDPECGRDDDVANGMRHTGL